jgi:hypothetical protein
MWAQSLSTWQRLARFTNESMCAFTLRRICSHAVPQPGMQTWKAQSSQAGQLETQMHLSPGRAQPLLSSQR